MASTTDCPPKSTLCLGFDWDHPSPLRHLAWALARDHRLLHVDSLGMRSPSADRVDAGRAWRRLAALARSRAIPHRVEGERDVHRLVPLALPPSPRLAVRAWNGRVVRRQIHAALRRLGIVELDLLLTALPSAAGLFAALPARSRVYYRVDEWGRWPGIDGARVADEERRLMDAADVTACTSRALLDGAWSRHGAPLHLPQAVDRAHFARALAQGPRHPALRGLSRPRLGFVGLLDDRLDARVLAHLARDWPGAVVLAGRHHPAAPPLPSSGSVHVLGEVPYDELPSLARGIDVWMIPYVVGPRTDAIDPLKLREYLATGRPVVSTPLPEVLRWSPHIAVADDPRAFARAARRAAAAPEVGRAARLAALDGHDWDDRRRSLLDGVAAARSRARGARRPR